MVIAAVEQLPEDTSLGDIADRIEFMAAVQKGVAEIDRGQGVPNEDHPQAVAAWLQADVRLPQDVAVHWSHQVCSNKRVISTGASLRAEWRDPVRARSRQATGFFDFIPLAALASLRSE
jgi:hypothetical protein